MRGLLLVALFFCGGCQIFLKGSYWDDRAEQERDSFPEGFDGAADVPFLGIRVPAQSGQFDIGVRVLHVFASSPAARAGVEEGDELRALAGTSVRSAADVRGVLARLEIGGVTSIVYAREGEEHKTRLSPVALADYAKERRRRIFSEATYGGMAFPFFFKYSTRHLTPAFIKAYFGVSVDEPVLVYEDLDILPEGLVGIGVSAFRRESLDLYDGSRTQIGCWPLRWSTGDDDRTGDLHELVPPGPKDVSDL